MSWKILDTKITKISGPRSYSILQPTQLLVGDQLQHNLYAPVLVIFGDRHVNMREPCNPCYNSLGCYKVFKDEWFDLLNKLGKHYNSKVDVYLETGLTAAKSHALLSKDSTYYKKYYDGVPETNYGFLYYIGKYYTDCFLRQPTCGKNYVRFNLVDPRSIFDFAEGAHEDVLKYAEDLITNLQTSSRVLEPCIALFTAYDEDRLKLLNNFVTGWSAVYVDRYQRTKLLLASSSIPKVRNIEMKTLEELSNEDFTNTYGGLEPGLKQQLIRFRVVVKVFKMMIYVGKSLIVLFEAGLPTDKLIDWYFDPRIFNTNNSHVAGQISKCKGVFSTVDWWKNFASYQFRYREHKFDEKPTELNKNEESYKVYMELFKSTVDYLEEAYESKRKPYVTIKMPPYTMQDEYTLDGGEWKKVQKLSLLRPSQLMRDMLGKLFDFETQFLDLVMLARSFKQPVSTSPRMLPSTLNPIMSVMYVGNAHAVSIFNALLKTGLYTAVDSYPYFKNSQETGGFSNLWDSVCLSIANKPNFKDNPTTEPLPPIHIDFADLLTANMAGKLQPLDQYKQTGSLKLDESKYNEAMRKNLALLSLYEQTPQAILSKFAGDEQNLYRLLFVLRYLRLKCCTLTDSILKEKEVKNTFNELQKRTFDWTKYNGFEHPRKRRAIFYFIEQVMQSRQSKEDLKLVSELLLTSKQGVPELFKVVSDSYTDIPTPSDTNQQIVRLRKTDIQLVLRSAQTEGMDNQAKKKAFQNMLYELIMSYAVNVPFTRGNKIGSGYMPEVGITHFTHFQLTYGALYCSPPTKTQDVCSDESKMSVLLLQEYVPKAETLQSLMNKGKVSEVMLAQTLVQVFVSLNDAFQHSLNFIHGSVLFEDIMVDMREDKRFSPLSTLSTQLYASSTSRTEQKREREAKVNNTAIKWDTRQAYHAYLVNFAYSSIIINFKLLTQNLLIQETAQTRGLNELYDLQIFYNYTCEFLYEREDDPYTKWFKRAYPMFTKFCDEVLKDVDEAYMSDSENRLNFFIYVLQELTNIIDTGSQTAPKPFNEDDDDGDDGGAVDVDDEKEADVKSKALRLIPFTKEGSLSKVDQNVFKKDLQTYTNVTLTLQRTRTRCIIPDDGNCLFSAVIVALEDYIANRKSSSGEVPLYVQQFKDGNVYKMLVENKVVDNPSEALTKRALKLRQMIYNNIMSPANLEFYNHILNIEPEFESFKTSSKNNCLVRNSCFNESMCDTFSLLIATSLGVDIYTWDKVKETLIETTTGSTVPLYLELLNSGTSKAHYNAYTLGKCPTSK